MPESGRKQILYAADRLRDGDGLITYVTMPREELVPFGGAAPVDVYVAVQDEAIVCLVLASWTDPSKVGPAVAAGLPEVAEILAKSMKGRRRPTAKTGVVAVSKPKGRATAKPPAMLPEPEPESPPRTPVLSSIGPRLPVGKGAMAGLVHLAGSRISAAKSMQAEPQIQSTSDLPPRLDAAPRGAFASMPDIVIGTTTLGRESLEAIEEDQALLTAAASTGGRFGSLPEIALGVAPLGRASLSAIDVDAHGGVPRGDPQSSMPDVRVSLATLPEVEEEELRLARSAMVPGSDASADPSSRVTQPWAESPIDTKRAAEAARGARGRAAPKVSIRLSSLDEETAIAMFEDEEVAPPESGETRSRDVRATQDSYTQITDEDLVEVVDDDREASLPMAVGLDESGAQTQEGSGRGKGGRRSQKSLDVWRDAIEKILDQEGERSPSARSGGGSKTGR